MRLLKFEGKEEAQEKKGYTDWMGLKGAMHTRVDSKTTLYPRFFFRPRQKVKKKKTQNTKNQEPRQKSNSVLSKTISSVLLPSC